MPNLQTFDKKNLLVGDAVISIQGGLYSLNDLHRASGGHPNHQPSNFLKLEGTQELAREISKEINQSYDSMTGVLEVVRGGNNPGTYVCKELVYAYAMWVSAAFNLRVIRAFDAGVSAPALPDFPTRPKRRGHGRRNTSSGQRWRRRSRKTRRRWSFTTTSREATTLSTWRRSPKS